MAMDDPCGGAFMFHDPSFFPENDTLDAGGESYSNYPDGDDPLSDPCIWNLCNDVSLVQGFEFSNFEDTNQMLPLSVPTPHYDCAFCHTLREITHTNGSIVKRLEIHGMFGVITHAVLGIYALDSSIQCEDIQMIDFGNEGMQTVKMFMLQYFEACKQEGYHLLEDPLSSFYEALCVGLDKSDYPDMFLRFSQENSGKCPNGQLNELADGCSQVSFAKIPLSMQRERTRKLRLKDFVDYSDLPIEEAARRMNICPTAMKKICRKNGVTRWPYRKIRSLKKKISERKRVSEAGDEHERARAQADIRKHQQELACIYEEFNK